MVFEGSMYVSVHFTVVPAPLWAIKSCSKTVLDLELPAVGRIVSRWSIQQNEASKRVAEWVLATKKVR